MSRYFTEEEGQTAKWEKCIFCRRSWLADSLELELCPDCLSALREHPGSYEIVRLEQWLKLGDFKDEDLREAVYLLLQEMKKL